MKANDERPAAPPGWPPPLGPLLRLLAVRPWLWWTALVTLWRMGAPGWWRRGPPIPRPPAEYWRFRMETALGSQPGSALSADDVVAYLNWCRRMPG